jgi:hypothetical protein
MTGALRILIVTYNWPPRNAIGTHRPYAWARQWSEKGAKITVLTAQKQFFDEPLDLNLLGLKGVRIIEVPYGLGEPSVVRRLLLNPFVLSALRRVKLSLQKGTSISIDPRLAWFKAALPLANDLALEHDFVVSTFGPAASHLLARAAKQANPAIFWVADYRDLWSQQPRPMLSQAALDKMQAEEMASVGRHADLITAVSEDMVRRLSEFCQGDVLLVPNGFDIAELELKQTLSKPFRPSSPPIKIVHTGTIYRGHRNPAPLLEVLAKMVESREIAFGDVYLDFYGRALDPVQELQMNPRFKPFLRLFGHVPREAALQAQREADLLLLLESSDVASRGVLTGKVFEYITTGRPIICVGSHPEYEIGLLLQRTATGKVFDDTATEEMVSVVADRLQNAGPPTWFAPDLNEILRYSRKTQALALLDGMMKRRG